MKEAKGVHYDTELDANDLKELAEKFKAVYKEAMKGEEFRRGSEGTVNGSCESCIPFLGQPACDRLPSYERYSGRLGYRSKRTDNGI